jgi:hypothetical protein
MPGDLKECRSCAQRCLELADRAKTPEGRKIFLRLVDQWDHLAKELDHAHARLVALKENHYRRLPGFPYD